MDVNMGGRTRKAIVEVGKTGWAYILDRETGKPLIGIDEKAGAAGTAAEDRCHAAVPARRLHRAAVHRDRARGHSARERRPHLHAVRRRESDARGSGHLGRRELAAVSYDPVQQRLFVCASSVINGFTGGGDREVCRPDQRHVVLGGATTFTRVARTGIIAALDVTTNKLAWRYQWPEQCYSGTLHDGGGLAFRRPQRWPS
jgi:hypothetical protein